jgi:pre-mRNA-splicing factor 38A
MANRTQPGALSIHGTDPQNLVEKIVRNRIHAAKYWNEDCFGLDGGKVVSSLLTITAATLTDKAMDLREVGGTYGGNYKATPFLCLVLKMLQLAPPKEIAVELINAEDHKYMRCLGAFYLRLTGKPVDVYVYLEALYNDYRKLRWRTASGGFYLLHSVFSPFSS